MGIEIDYNAKSNVVYVTGNGFIDFRQFPAFREKITSVIAIASPGMKILSDYRNAHVDVNFSEMYQCASAVKKLTGKLGKVKEALIVSGKLGYGTARMYSSMMMESNVEIELFRRYDEGQQWLEIPAEESGYDNSDTTFIFKSSTIV